VNNPKRNHHVTPKLYLKGFVVEKSETDIWVYKRGKPYNPGDKRTKNNPYKDTIKNAGVERDFYADPKGDGIHDFETIENKLELLEKPADPIFEKLRAHQTINKEEKNLFSSYIINMYKRVPASREKVKELLATKSYEPTKEFFEQANLPNTPEIRAAAKRKAEELAQQKGIDIQIHNWIAASPDSFLIEALQKMVWTFYTAPAPHAFVTSDNPVFISEQFGLGKNISELSFPISSDVILVASWNRFLKEGFFEAPSQFLKELNRRTINGASQFVYFSQSPEWVLTMLNKDSYVYRPMYSAKSIYDVVRFAIDGADSKPHLVWS
jgi:Protein of unknown function (DUF4238)